MIKQISLIALVAIGVTALFFGASITLAHAATAIEYALAAKRISPGLEHSVPACKNPGQGTGREHNPHC
jgi:hypothetical protein